MRTIVVATAIACASVATAAEPQLAFQPQGEGVFEFNTGAIRGRLRLDGRNQGIDELVHLPSGQEVTYGQHKLALLSHYRVFTTNKRFGDAARDWPTDCALLPDGAVKADFRPDDQYPFSMTAVFRIAKADAIDVETIVTAHEPLPRFEVFLSNYFGKGYDASVYVIHSLRAPGEPYFLSADHNPLVAGNYLLFPRDRESVLTVFDGRWEQPPHSVEWCVTRYLAAPIGVRRHNQSGLTAVVMASAEDCFAVATPYNQDPPDGVANHRSLYLSLFGSDVAKANTIRAVSRLQILAAPSDEGILRRYHDFLTDSSSSESHP